MSELRPYEKPCKRINATQAECKEGTITVQTCGKKGSHPLAFAWLFPKKGKGRWVLVCLECGIYEETVVIHDEK